MSSNSDNESKIDDSRITPDELLPCANFQTDRNSVSPVTEESADADFESLIFSIEGDLITSELITVLLGFFKQNTYTSSSQDPRPNIALNRVLDIFAKDYQFTNIENQNSSLSKFYPSQIPFLQCEKSKKPNLNVGAIKCLLPKAKNARCRQRFPVPVILCNDKYICRSATIAGCPEVYGRTAISTIFDEDGERPPAQGAAEEFLSSYNSEVHQQVGENSWQRLEEGRYADVSLLEQMRVGTIVDLMVETKKRKLGVPVSSSEKVESEGLYVKRFNLVSLPYPGCEFFKKFYSNAHNAEGLLFDFDQPMCNAEIHVSSIPDSLKPFNIEWDNYKKWDLNTITRNYLLYVLKQFEESDKGVLVHCISGWDRTPLFISLLRLSLWADGLIHKSVGVQEMLYLVLGYDWMLFGHHLSDRLGKSEDILLFCFTFLKELSSDEFKSDPSCFAGDKEKATNGKKQANDNAKNGSSAENGNVMEANNGNSNGNSNSSSDLEPTINLPFVLNIDSPNSENGKEVLKRTNDKISTIEEGEEADLTISAPVDIPKRPKSNASVASSTDGWQVVSGTGSVRSGHSESDLGSPDSTPRSDVVLSRQEKLMAVRKLFYKCYFQVLKDDIQYIENRTPLMTVLGQLAGYATTFLKKGD